jgi:hypothetical protein
MYIVGQEEIDAIAAVIREGALFRYGIGSECDRFEQRYAEHLGTRHVALTASGTYALTAAVTALGIGPGEEVLVPAHTYMATAMAVLAAGAIPVIVDVDESITIDPDAIDDAVGPHPRRDPRAHVGRRLRNGPDHGGRGQARPPGAGGHLPGYRRRLRREKARHHRPRRRVLLQLLQEHDRGRRRRGVHRR